MEVMIICIYMLILIIIGLVVFAVMQIKLAGIKVKDFMSLYKQINCWIAYIEFQENVII